jgi:beta-phosphoglucomutase
MSYQAFLFDLDGVIVDTAVYHYQAWRRLANEKLGFDLSEEFNETLKGISRGESLERIIAHGNVTVSEIEKATLATLKNEWYLELIKQMSPADVLPGVTDFLDEVHEANIKIGLGSVSRNAGIILERINLFDRFDVIIDGNKIKKGKPDPEVFLNGAAFLQIIPSNCVVFEDAVAGIEAAKRANMLAIGIGNSEILTQADYVIPGFATVNFDYFIKLIQ